MNIKKLERKANQIRNSALETSIRSGCHLASSLSCIDILVAIYYSEILHYNPRNPAMEERDRFILSKGHGELALYIILADLGFFPDEWIKNHYRKGDCRLGGHPDYKTPGIEVTTGSLGHGLGIGAGISLAAKIDKKSHFQYVLLGDAECTEGSIWESAMFACKHGLHNLIAIVDRNFIGATDFTEKYTSLEPFDEKWQSFGWETKICNGHNFEELLHVLHYSRSRKLTNPLVIIAETVKGKGISFIENDPQWHVRRITTDEEIRIAKQNLKKY